MIRIIMMFCIAGLLSIFQSGCGRETDTVYLENAAQDTARVESTAMEQTLPEEGASQAEVCYVYVCGAVANPGVYELAADSRIYEAIALAGGLLDTAGAEAVNQAGVISDGQMIRIPTREEAESGQAEMLLDETTNEAAEASDGRVDINTASAEELMTLSGIGQSKADAIINYRTKHGGFSKIEDIMNIEGIKEGVYNRIKDDIKVK